MQAQANDVPTGPPDEPERVPASTPGMSPLGSVEHEVQAQINRYLALRKGALLNVQQLLVNDRTELDRHIKAVTESGERLHIITQLDDLVHSLHNAINQIDQRKPRTWPEPFLKQMVIYIRKAQACAYSLMLFNHSVTKHRKDYDPRSLIRDVQERSIQLRDYYSHNIDRWLHKETERKKAGELRDQKAYEQAQGRIEIIDDTYGNHATHFQCINQHLWNLWCWRVPPVLNDYRILAQEIERITQFGLEAEQYFACMEYYSSSLQHIDKHSNAVKKLTAHLRILAEETQNVYKTI